MTIEDTERELAQQAEGIDPDLSISNSDRLAIIEPMRQQAVVNYHAHLYAARLNDLVENTKESDLRRKMAKDLVVQINQMDKDIKQLRTD